jgi:hypothetical protein
MLFSMTSGSGLWNRASSVVQQIEEKCEFSLFSFVLGAFAFFALFLRFALANAKVRKRVGAHL